MNRSSPQRLVEAAPDLERILNAEGGTLESPMRFETADIRRETVWVIARDGIKLATDLYLPPALPAPAVAMRTPYGRASERFSSVLLAFAQRGYVVISQDCRGTGDSEPDVWDFGIYEPEDGMDFVAWASQQHWYNGLLFSFGGSYGALTPLESIRHYEDVARTMGGIDKTRDFYRLFMVPGMDHCAGGPGANAFGQYGQRPLKDDADHSIMRALETWVETGRQPDRIIAAKYIDDDPQKGVAFTRPLCPYPEVAVYSGAGSLEKASTFQCQRGLNP